MCVDSYSGAVPFRRVQREQIIAKQQEEETARLKNSGKNPKGSKDGLRPESPHSRRPRRPPVRKIVQANKTRFEVCPLFLPFLFQVLNVQRADTVTSSNYAINLIINSNLLLNTLLLKGLLYTQNLNAKTLKSLPSLNTLKVPPPPPKKKKKKKKIQKSKFKTSSKRYAQ